jgi:hypothetical protein
MAETAAFGGLGISTLIVTAAAMALAAFILWSINKNEPAATTQN